MGPLCWRGFGECKLKVGLVEWYSTLDPSLRMEQHGISPLGIVLTAAFVSYLFATPGVAVRIMYKRRNCVKVLLYTCLSVAGKYAVMF